MKPKGIERFSSVRELDRSKITLNPLIFQGRPTPFSRATVNKIVREGYDKSQDPIVVWYCQKLKKYVVISGHSRFEASRILYKKGVRSLQTMPVKIFIGDEDDATDYAILESNRSGDVEPLKSDLKAYKRAFSRGHNKKYLQGIFKPDSYLHKLQAWSNLDDRGLFLQHLGEDSEVSFPYLQRNAVWTGNLRKQYPQLTNAHEKELFNFFYASKKGLHISKSDFYNLIYKKVSDAFFDKRKTLNLLNYQHIPAAQEGSPRESLNRVKRDVKDLLNEHDYKTNLIADINELLTKEKNKAERDRLIKLRKQYLDYLTGLEKKILEKKTRQRKLERDILHYESKQSDLFSQATTPKPKEPSDSEKQKKLKLAKAKAQALKLKLQLLKI